MMVRALWTLLWQTNLRWTILAAVCGSLLLIFRRASPGLKHQAWRGVLYASFLLPSVELIAPRIHPPASILPPIAGIASQTEVQAMARSAQSHTPFDRPLERRNMMPLVVAAVYAGITMALLLRFRTALVRIRKVVRRSVPFTSPSMAAIARNAWLESPCQYQPQIRVSAEARVPIVVGFHEPVILLPSGCERWPSDKLRAVLLHELEHVRRHDARTQVIGSLATCLFWLNPAVWWLQRHLASLAEEACDESVIEWCSPRRYASILIDFASVMDVSRSRLAVDVPIGTPHIERRLQRIFASPRPLSRRFAAALSASLMVLFFPALYVAGATGLQRASENVEPRMIIVSAHQARRAEHTLLKDPEDLRLRAALTTFYFNSRQYVAYERQILWAIRHHPANPLLRQFVLWRLKTGLEEEILQAWDQALDKYPNVPDVMVSAASSVQLSDTERAFYLFNRARNITPADSPVQGSALQGLAAIDATAVMVEEEGRNHRINNMQMTRELARKLREQLDLSSDAELLSGTGTMIVHMSPLTDLGLLYIERAISAAPSNTKWKEALESARAEPARRASFRALLADSKTAQH